MTPQSPKTVQDQRKLDAQHDLIKTVRANNPYQLDHDGMLQLPGFRSIALAGLTEAAATRRVASEPAFEDFEVRVIRLPLAKSGKEALQPYGYDLFTAASRVWHRSPLRRSRPTTLSAPMTCSKCSFTATRITPWI